MFYDERLAKMSEVDAKWAHQVNKQICEMTRAVFHLHASALDPAETIDNLRHQYQDEISLIAESSKHEIADVEKEAETYRSNLKEIVGAEFKTKYELARLQFEKQKEKLQRDFDNLYDSTTKRFNSLKEQFEKLKKQINSSEYREAIKEIDTLKKQVNDYNESQRQKSLINTAELAEKKYSDLLSQKEKEESSLRAKYAKELREINESFEHTKASTLELLNKRESDWKTAVLTLQIQKKETEEENEAFLKEAKSRITIKLPKLL